MAAPKLDKPTSIGLRKANKDDLASIAEISDATLGVGYFDTKKLPGYLIVADIGGVVVGFCSGGVWEPDKFVAQVLKSRVYCDKELGGPVAALQTIAVHPEYQKHGIGFELGKRCVADLMESTCRLFSPAWQQPDGRINAASLLNKLGFLQVANFPEFWTEESTREGYGCPCCGNPCRCGMVLYALPENNRKD